MYDYGKHLFIHIDDLLADHRFQNCINAAFSDNTFFKQTDPKLADKVDNFEYVAVK